MVNLFVMRDGRNLEVCEYGDPQGHPIFFFHGLVGSHHQASYVAEQARRGGLRILAPNRPGVGRSDFVARRSPLDVVPDVEDVADALGLEHFSLIGISGGTPYALATLHRLARRVRTATVISGMGPLRLPGALQGMRRSRRLSLKISSRYPELAKPSFRRWTDHVRKDPKRFLDRLVSSWALPDRELFRRKEIYDLFLRDLHQVFVEGKAPESLSQELRLYGNFGFALGELPKDRRVVLWQGLSDNIVPPAMTWKMAQSIPNCEAHFVPGGHFMAVDLADQMISRLRQLLDASGRATSPR
jgi:pimeloyl-ACP methyl ester carboxylesterase